MTYRFSNFFISSNTFSGIQRGVRENPGAALFAAMGDINRAAFEAQSALPEGFTSSEPIERIEVIRVSGQVASVGHFVLFFLGELEPDNNLASFEWAESLMVEAGTLIRAEIANRCNTLKKNPFIEVECMTNMAVEVGLVRQSQKSLFASWLAGAPREDLSYEQIQEWLDGFTLVWERWAGSPLDPRNLVHPNID